MEALILPAIKYIIYTKEIILGSFGNGKPLEKHRLFA